RVDTKKNEPAQTVGHLEGSGIALVADQTGAEIVVGYHSLRRVVEKVAVQHGGMVRVNHVALISLGGGEGVFPDQVDGSGRQIPPHPGMGDFGDVLPAASTGALQSPDTVATA